MIHDPVVEVTCDGERCRESVYTRLAYTYGGVMHTKGSYDADDAQVEARLMDDHNWRVKSGRHYCSDDCAAG